MMRIRSSSRMKQTAVVRDLWRQLKAAGWELKKPTRLSRNWGYFEPRTDESELVDGPIFFTGEDDVVSFAITSGLIKLNESSEDDGSTVDGINARRGEDSGEDRRDEASGQPGVNAREQWFDGSGRQKEGDVGEQRESAVGDIVSASQIDCSLVLSAPTFDAYRLHWHSNFSRCISKLLGPL
ncbi:hypothetical protein PC119_g15541 [Phytophthora cactorum]|nr:hypothetical protein PC114_g19830 [Phytophthora cactorum]KAG3004678.1 hypothetical protein PC119_g15541 [Phytophthora cactorum]KAG3139787.1 hypothetical protein C6341_g20231 [Phytophthora cactorum]